MLISVGRFKQGNAVKLYKVHLYANQFLMILIGLGIGHPVITYAAGLKTSNPNASPVLSSLGSGWTTVIAVVILIGWELFKGHLRTEEIEKKFNLIKVCETKCQAFHHRCIAAIQTVDPMPELDEIHRGLTEIADLCCQNGVWPDQWKPFAPGAEEEAEREVEDRIKEVRNSLWKPDQEEGRGQKFDNNALLKQLEEELPDGDKQLNSKQGDGKDAGKS